MLVDLGCGPATLIRRHARLFARAVGVDFAEPVLERARQSCRAHPDAEFLCADVEAAGSLLPANRRRARVHERHHVGEPQQAGRHRPHADRGGSERRDPPARGALPGVDRLRARDGAGAGTQGPSRIARMASSDTAATSRSTGRPRRSTRRWPAGASGRCACARCAFPGPTRPSTRPSSAACRGPGTGWRWRGGGEPCTAEDCAAWRPGPAGHELASRSDDPGDGGSAAGGTWGLDAGARVRADARTDGAEERVARSGPRATLRPRGPGPNRRIR